MNQPPPLPPSHLRAPTPIPAQVAIDPDDSIVPNAGVRAVVADDPPAAPSSAVHPLEIRRGIVVDTAAIISLAVFAVMALWKDHEGAAMAAVMAIPHIVGVRTALRTAGAVATSQSATVAIIGFVAAGFGRIAGKV